MPWCATCDRYLSPSTVRTDASCPACGATVQAAPSKRGRGLAGIPWHVRLLIAVFALYLLYRIGQGVGWLVDQL